MPSYKQVAFFNENPGDIFVSFTITGTSTTFSPGAAVNTLQGFAAVSPTSPWYQATDSNSVIDACAQLTGTQTATATFKRADNTTYTKDSQDFIGGRPPHRPTL